VPPLTVAELEVRAKDVQLPDGTPYRALSMRAIAALAGSHGLEGYQVEILALQNELVPLRYLRNLKSFSFADQIALLQSAVAVIGVGGLGGVVGEILARAGVGTLRLVDGDVFEEHNFNRQLVSAPDHLGQAKAQVAASRLRRINPSLNIECVVSYLNETNGADLARGMDVIVDCLDTLTSRFTLEAIARKVKVPLVSAAVAGAMGQVTVIMPGDPGLAQIYGDAAEAGDRGVETSLGCLAHGVFFLASLEAAEVLKLCRGKGQSLRHKLLIADLEDHSYEVLDLS
jgi:molybdopterin/thiamine biosynthesis adenylyltransferase